MGEHVSRGKRNRNIQVPFDDIQRILFMPLSTIRPAFLINQSSIILFSMNAGCANPTQTYAHPFSLDGPAISCRGTMRLPQGSLFPVGLLDLISMVANDSGRSVKYADWDDHRAMA